MTVRVGFLGAGLIAGFHARSLAASRSDFAFAGVHDAVRAKAEEFAGWTGATVCDGEEEVLAGCDAVYVCTWTSEHRRLVELAVDARRAVFCEKPLAVDLTGARAMADTVADAGVTNQVGLVLRSSPSIALLEHMISDPASGRLLSITFHDDQILPVKGDWYTSEWRADPARAGSGVLMEHSIHDIDVLERLGGPVDRVAGHSTNVHGHEGIEDLVAATFHHESGAVATLTTVWHDIPERLNDRRIEVTCERFYGMLTGEWIGPLRWQRPGESPQELQGATLLARVEELGLGQPNPDGAFVAAVAAGTPASPDFATAVRAHTVVDAVYRSAAQLGAAVAVG